MVGSNESGENDRFRRRREDVHLPTEIILEILSRLPVESILRCRSVCKSWNNLKQDPFFINLQLSRANDQPKRIILQSIGAMSRLYLVDVEMDKVRIIPEIPQISAMDDYDWDNICTMNSLDGWLCMSRVLLINPVVIYNPLTAEHMILPKSKHDEFAIIGNKVCIGFDSSVKKYKVVRIYDYFHDVTGDECCRCEVITLGESTSWGELSLPCRILHKGHPSPVFTSGRMWWIINKKNHDPLDRRFILHFDLTSETFQTLEFPPSIKAPVLNPDFPTGNLRLQIIGRHAVLVEYDGRSLHSWRIVPSQQDGHYSVAFSSVDMLIPWYAKCFRSLVDMPHPNKMLLELNGLKALGFDQNNLVAYIPNSKVHIRLSIPGIPESFYATSFNPSFFSISSAFLNDQ